MNIPLQDWSGARAVEDLHASINALAAASNAQTRQMLRLTWALLTCTVAMIIVAVLQLVAAMG